jgi:hypothetical protein
MAADDAHRGDLFGGAKARTASKPNPYASIAPSEAPAAPNPFDDTPAPQPAPQAATSSPEASALFAGSGRQARARTITSTADAGAATSAAPPPPPEDDGMLALDYLDDLNMTEGHQRAEEVAELDFDEIDNDLVSGAASCMLREFPVGQHLLHVQTKFAQDLVIRDALARGVDLRIYARQVDSELRGMETASIKDYVQESDAIAGLYEQIEACESVLGQMQGLLQGFQENLGGISTEIRTLQVRRRIEYS